MPRTRKPESAAKVIIDMISKKEATDAADAVRQRPELEPELSFLKEAVNETPSETTAKSASKPTPAATGSGPRRFTR